MEARLCTDEVITYNWGLISIGDVITFSEPRFR